MKATSVIDTMETNMMIGQPGQEMRVPIGGIAHAGVRGISKVELRVVNGEWMPAELRTPLSGQTWVVWRRDWPMQKGKHSFTVRCFRGTARRRSNGKRLQTRAAPAGWTHAPSCSEEASLNRPRITQTSPVPTPLPYRDPPGRVVIDSYLGPRRRSRRSPRASPTGLQAKPSSLGRSRSRQFRRQVPVFAHD
jgi:hypothetical protein